MSHYGISLPETLPHFKDADRKDVDDQWQQAYKTCLQYEARGKSCFDYIRSRALGYLIREAPYDESRDWICQEINSSLGENVKLQDLADLYIGSFLQVFRPSSSWSRPSSPSFDTMEDSPEKDLEPTPLTTSIEQALKRDNYRCIVTGVYTLDLEHAPKTPHPVGCMEVIHILPSSMNAGVASEDKASWIYPLHPIPVHLEI
ncbi:hypothetical protein OG21DRAFT_1483968 [Imleria badia]|nr:hypothetical protein OG21DRAFT_1483968 [Imleria badia]